MFFPGFRVEKFQCLFFIVDIGMNLFTDASKWCNVVSYHLAARFVPLHMSSSVFFLLIL